MSTPNDAPGYVPGITLSATPATGKAGKFVTVAVNGVGELHRDAIDPNSATSRKRFIGATMQAAFPDKPPDDWPDALRSDLDRQLAALAAVPPGDPDPPPAAKPAPADPRVAELEKTPTEVRAEAEGMLLDPKLLERVSADTGALGVVGEKANRLILYLVGTSAQLARPLAVITRGRAARASRSSVNR